MSGFSRTVTLRSRATLVIQNDHLPRYNTAQAKARFSELVDKALAGEEVVIARDNRPLLKMVPYHDASTPRTPGSARGRIWIADDFDAPLHDFAEYW